MKKRWQTLRCVLCMLLFVVLQSASPIHFEFVAANHSQTLFSPFGLAVSGGDQKLYCGYTHTIAVKSDSTVWAWGNNNKGQLGIGTTGQLWYPVQIAGLATIVDAAGGFEHTVSLKKDGTVWTWGRNAEGELGNGSLTQQTLPIQASSLTNVVNVAAGYYHSFAVKGDGSLWSWGKNSNGQLGVGNTANSSAPMQVNTINTVKDVSGGEEFSIALKNDNSVWTWGYNGQGQLGDGTTTQRTAPVRVGGSFTATAISAGRDHAVALKADGTVWAWGNNNYGQLGNGNKTNQKIPVQVNSLTNIVAIAAGENHSIALKQDGTVWAWGFNGDGQLGSKWYDSASYTNPIPTDFITTANTVSAGTHSIAAKTDGSTWGWGSNINGQLGTGTNISALSPQNSIFTFATAILAKPIFSPDAGNYSTAQTVTISASSPGVTIRYTTNGLDPAPTDPAIASGSTVSIPKGVTQLKARAFKAGFSPSETKTAVYQTGDLVITGYTHSLAIRSDTILWAWGNN